jgi:hypothetical protein
VERIFLAKNARNAKKTGGTSDIDGVGLELRGRIDAWFDAGEGISAGR